LANGRLAGSVESRVRFGGIDWKRTRAFSEELNYNPSIWLNLVGRDAAGIVAASDRDRVRSELSAALLQWRDPFSGEAVVRRVWQREELYTVECVEDSPDLILDLATPGGYSYMCLPSLGSDGPALERLAGRDL